MRIQIVPPTTTLLLASPEVGQSCPWEDSEIDASPINTAPQKIKGKGNHLLGKQMTFPCSFPE